MELKVIEINQPIGTFYIAKIRSNDLIKYSFVNRRDLDGDGVQRRIMSKRVDEIAEYCKDPDATFPTPIIASLDSKKVELTNDKVNISTDNINIFEIIDGQHRRDGIKLGYERYGFECDLIIVLMFDLTEEEKGYVFSTINSNQAKVDKSLIYDLFELSEKRSPLKTSHYIARTLNKEKDSPFQGRLKMLGTKVKETETLSQGTFVHGIVGLISKSPQSDMIKIKRGETLEDDKKYPLRTFFIKEQDAVILKIIKNYFNAVKVVFPREWNSPDYILSKTTGFLGLIKAFSFLYEKGIERGTLEEEFFVTIFNNMKVIMNSKNLIFNSNDFRSGASGQKDISELVKQSYDEKLFS